MEIVRIVAAVLLILFAVILLLTHIIMKKRFYRGEYPKHPVPERFYEAYRDRYPRRSVSFLSGKNRLQGYVYGEENTKGLIVFAHGIGAGHETYIKELLWMVDHGWRVLAYDATGSCTSEGDGTGGLVQSALDLHAALTWVEHEPTLSHLPVCLMGHSWGGYAVTAGLWFGHDVKASVSLAGYADPLRMIAEFARLYMGRAVLVFLPFVRIWLWMRHGRLGSLTAVKGIDKGEVPVLLVHGTADEVVTADRVSIAREAGHLKNPNVRVLWMDAEGQNAHGSILRHKDSISYIEEVDREIKQIKREYGEGSPNAALEAFLSTVDRDAYNRPNDDLLEEIHAFFLASI